MEHKCNNYKQTVTNKTNWRYTRNTVLTNIPSSSVSNDFPYMSSSFSEYLLEKMALLELEKDADLARKLDFSRATINRWLHEKVTPGYTSMRKIAKNLGVPIQEVIDAVEGKYIPISEGERNAIVVEKRYGSNLDETIDALIKRREERRKGKRNTG
jgi:transcriptional regulator with XRE-family HTH domain